MKIGLQHAAGYSETTWTSHYLLQFLQMIFCPQNYAGKWGSGRSGEGVGLMPSLPYRKITPSKLRDLCLLMFEGCLKSEILSQVC